MTNKKFDNLRKRAEERLGFAKDDISEMTENDVRKALHELRTHQIELEMQNEELRKTQIELEQSRKNFSDLYDFAPEGYLTVSDKGIIIEANLTATVMLGVTRSALIKRPLAQFIFPEDQDIYYQHHKKVFETDLHQACELRMLGSFGTPFWVHLKANAVQDDDGVPMGRFVLTDITAQKQAELAMLRENEGQYREERDKLQKFFDVAEVMLLAINASQEVILINKKGCDILGYSQDEIIGKNWFDNFLPERLREEVVKIFNKLVAGEVGPVEHFKNPILNKNGEERLIAWHNGVWCDENGHFMYSVGSGEDITERERAEEELRLQSEIINKMTEGVYLVRMDGIIVYTNPKFEEMFGYDPGGMIGRHASMLNYPNEKNPEETAREILDILDKDGIWQGEIQNIRKDGTPFWCYASVVVFDHSKHGKVLVAVHTDITARREFEEERKKLLTKLQNALNEIRTLKGILPFCSFCKKIRNDTGYWEQVDVYITRHSEADISHSICPDCARKNYPEIFDSEPSKNK